MAIDMDKRKAKIILDYFNNHNSVSEGQSLKEAIENCPRVIETAVVDMALKYIKLGQFLDQMESLKDAG